MEMNICYPFLNMLVLKAGASLGFHNCKAKKRGIFANKDEKSVFTRSVGALHEVDAGFCHNRRRYPKALSNANATRYQRRLRQPAPAHI